MRTVPQRHRGFTIIELMTTITVLAVLLGIGVPAFNDMVRNNRTANETNDLVTGFAIARSEASKRGLPVSICAAKTGDKAADGCAAVDAADWAKGWLVFTDRMGTPGTVDAGDEVLLVSRQVTNGLHLTTNAIGFVRFGANGERMNPSATDVLFSLKHDECSGDNRREIAIIRTGRANLSKKPCT